MFAGSAPWWLLFSQLIGLLREGPGLLRVHRLSGSLVIAFGLLALGAAAGGL